MGSETYANAVLKAWPDGLPAPTAGLRIDDAGMVATIEHDGIGLPPPFHSGISFGYVGHAKTEDVADLLLMIVTKTADVCDLMREQADRLYAIADGADIKVDGYHPNTILRMDDGTIGFDILTRVNALNASGRMEQSFHNLGTTGFGESGWTDFKRLARQQKERREISGRALRADPVMAGALRDLTGSQRRRLLDHLREHPQVPNDEKTLSMESNWTQPSLARHGVRLPPAVETIQVRKGVIIGRVRLTPNTTWNAGTIVHSGKRIPHSIAAGLASRRAAEVVEHPALDDDILIISAQVDRANRLRMKTRYAEVDVLAA